MAEHTCVDGATLEVRPVAVLDLDGTPYEVTLTMLLDGQEFGEVGERCGFFVAGAARRLRTARAQDPDGFPASSVEAGVRSYAVDQTTDPGSTWTTLSRYLPRDRELFCFRARDPDDLGTVGALRVALEEERTWLPGPPGRWRIDCRAVLEAWGASGRGVRAVLSSGELQEMLDALVTECAAVGVRYDQDHEAGLPRRPAG
ncbi:MAG: hypothetical protein JJD92_04675 [Frankiaceae bacterium]|nr:hypothetical protein [Frankiaceae bacterium]